MMKEMEEELRQSDTKFRTIVEHMHDMVYTYDSNGMMRHMSPSCRVYGYREEDFIGRPVTDFFHSDDHPLLYEAAMRGVNGELFTLILRFLTKSREARYMEVTGKVSHFLHYYLLFERHYKKDFLKVHGCGSIIRRKEVPMRPRRRRKPMLAVVINKHKEAQLDLHYTEEDAGGIC